jgi:PAS domain S-box-containing protein
MKALIADDDPTTLKMLSASLEKWGFDVITAKDGAEAVEVMLADDPPKMAILDWEMPELKGVDVVQKIREVPSLNSVYVMLYTTRGSTSDIVAGFKAGADDYLTKPVDLRELKARTDTGTRIVTLQAQLESRAETAEADYQSIFDNALEGIFQLDMNGGYIRVNPALAEMLGYSSVEELMDVDWRATVVDKEKLSTIERTLQDKGSMKAFDLELETKDGSRFWGLLNVILRDHDGQTIYEGLVQDITEKKTEELRMRYRMMRYRLEAGNLYLIQEMNPDASVISFTDLINIGLRGTIISREPDETFRSRIEGEFRHKRLSSKKGDGTLPPDVEEIEGMIGSLPRRDAVMVDRLDYVISKNGFDNTLELVQNIRDLALLRDLTVLIVIDPDTVESRQLRLLEKECRELQPLHETLISDELMAILRLIAKNIDMNVKTSYSMLIDDLRISKPTARKRIQTLISLGYVSEMVTGRLRTFILTEKGRSMFKR